MNALKRPSNTIAFPERLNHKTVALLCAKIEAVCARSTVNKTIFFDASTLKFIDAFSMTALFNEIADIKSRNWKTYICGHIDAAGNLKEPIRFMDDCEFFLLMSGKRLSLHSGCRDSSLPIKRLLPIETVAWLRFTAMPWLARLLNTNTNALVEIQVCLEELFNNTRDHSGIEFSSIFIQYYPRCGEIKICLSDNGIGLVEKIRKSHPDLLPEEAVSHALREGFTTKSSPRNAGMGLFTLTSVICNNGGQFALRTGNVYSLVTADGNGAHRISHLTNEPFFKGTAFEITLFASELDLQQGDMEEFSWDW